MNYFILIFFSFQLSWAQDQKDCPEGFSLIDGSCIPAMGMFGQFMGMGMSGEIFCDSPNAAQSKAKHLLENARSNVSIGKAGSIIQQLKKHSKKCNVDLNKNFGVDESQLSLWERQSTENLIKKQKKEISEAVEFGYGENLIRDYEATISSAGRKLDLAEIAEWKAEIQKSQENDKASCTKIDMRPKFAPVRDQDSIGWCYAFAAADILSYNSGKEVSALDVALSYNEDNKNFKGIGKKYFDADETSYEGGKVANAVSASAKKGLCLDEKFSSDDSKKMSTKQAIKSVEEIKSKANSKDPNFWNCDMRGFNRLFPYVNIKDFFEIVQKTTKVDFFNKLADKACEPRLHNLKNAKAQTINFHRASAAKKNQKFQEVDEQLTKNNPVALSFYARLFFPGSDGGHAVTIVGREWDTKTKQCEYIIRNSWGPNCFWHNNFKCKDGYAHVPRGRLIQEAISADYIEK